MHERHDHQRTSAEGDGSDGPRARGNKIKFTRKKPIKEWFAKGGKGDEEKGEVCVLSQTVWGWIRKVGRLGSAKFVDRE